MTDPIDVGARSAAERLTRDYGPGLAADVEAALHTRGLEQRPEQYFDPVSIGSLIVSIATLTWTVYTDLKKKTPNPPPDVVGRTVHVELRKRGGTGPASREKITDVVVTEIIKAIDDPRLHLQLITRQPPTTSRRTSSCAGSAVDGQMGQATFVVCGSC